MGVPFQVRSATPTDAPQLARLNLLFNSCDEPAENYAARLADPGRVDTPLLAETNGRAVAFANLRLLQPVFYPEPYAELTELFVEEAYRRQGVGRLLVAHAERLALAGGALKMHILTSTDNLPAQAFYHSLGYTSDEAAFLKILKTGAID